MRLSAMRRLLSSRVAKLLFAGTLLLNPQWITAAVIQVPTGPDPVANGTAFQNAIINAQCGDTIILQAGATYQGPPIADQAFLLTGKSCTGGDYITIQTSNLAGISGDGVRLDPARHAAAMPKIVGDVAKLGMSVIATQRNAHHYKLVGLEITNNGANSAPDLVSIYPNRGSGPGGYATYEEVISIHDIIIDRCFIHPAEISATNLFASTRERTSARGVHVEGLDISIVNSYIAGFAGVYPSFSPIAGQTLDSMGIYSVAGPGPIHIVNNYIEAQYSNIFLGGGDNFTRNTAIVTNPTLTSATLSHVNNLSVGDLVAFSSAGTTPSPWETGKVTKIEGNNVSFTLIHPARSSELKPPDANGTARWNGMNVSNVEIRRNFLNKPDVWNSFSINPKAFIEIKDCVDCVLDGNNMYSGIGSVLGLTARSQGGSAPWARIENLTYTNNIMTGYKAGIISIGSDENQVSVPSGNWTIRNNVWYLPYNAYGPAPFLQLGGGILNGYNISFTHNTILQPGSMAHALSPTDGPFVFKDNIVGNGDYGIQCDVNASNLQSCFPGLQMNGNVIIGPPRQYQPYCTNQGAAVYPTGNKCVDNAGLIGFMDLAKNDYRLAATSPFKGKASDGTDPGVDMDALLAAQGSSSGSSSSSTRAAVTITEPPNGATVSGSVTVAAEASSDISVAYVQFYLEGQLASTSTAAPYSSVVDTRTVPNGARSLTAKVFDTAGRVSTSSPVSVTVSNPDVTLPAVSLTSPASGATVSGTTTLSASATDNDGVTRVEFAIDTIPVATSTTGPTFSAMVDTGSLSDAPHSISAKAYDAAGNVGYSDAITISVSNADTTAPTTAITAPGPTATVAGVTSVSATASDNVAVAKVEFLVDSVVTSVSTTSPYSYAMDTTKLSNASHKVASRAYDRAGNVGMSAPVSITVNNAPSETTAPTVTINVLLGRKGSPDTLSATATDNVGVARVEFYVDGKLLATDISAPYSNNLNLPGRLGSIHKVMAKAYDAAGNWGISQTITLVKQK
jgi:hypothetical protein